MNEPHEKLIDMDAEAIVLSAMLLGRFLDELLGELSDVHFYSQANQLVFAAVRDLRAEGTPVDHVTVATRLRDAGKLGTVGGTPYLATLMHDVPFVANTMAHAAIVREKWMRRQLVNLGRVMVTDARASESPGHELVRAHEAAIAELAATGLRTPVERVGPIAAREIELLARAAKTGETIGLSTGFPDLDRLTGGLYDGDLILVAGRPGMGKAQPVDARVLTPTGYRRMGDLAVGDQVIGRSGEPCVVKGVFERGALPVFRVVLDDGSWALSSEDHLWLTRTKRDRGTKRLGTVKELREIRRTLRAGAHREHSLPYARPVRFARGAALPIDPWLLGVYLGDGFASSVIKNPERDIQARVARLVGPANRTIHRGMETRIRARSGKRPSFRYALRALGLEGCRSWEKFIPAAYLRASVKDRERLLQGLCDTDGYVTDPSGSAIEYTTTSSRLRDDLVFLVQALGGRATWTEGQGRYRKDGRIHETRTKYRMVLSFAAGDVVPVSSKKHIRKYKPGGRRVTERFIDRVEEAGVAECRCITVSAPDGLYVTESCIVTHNSSFFSNVATNVSRPEESASLLFSLEMPRGQLALRVVASEGEIDFASVRRGRLDSRGWQALIDASVRIGPLPLWIDDTPAITVSDVRARARKLQREIEAGRSGTRAKRLGLIGVDYLQLMRGLRLRGDSRESEVASLSRDLKHLAKEMGVPVMALSQLNRRVEHRGGQERRPELSDLRESGALEQDADSIWFVYREEYYNEEATPGEAEIIVAKQRNGGLGTVKLHFKGPQMRFYPRATESYDDFDDRFDDGV